MKYIIFTILLFVQLGIYAQSTGDYRSKQSGNLEDAANWETYNGTSWVAAINYPTSSDGTITIRSPHIISRVSNNAIDDVTVEVGATLNLNAGSFANGPQPVDLRVYGTVNHNYGSHGSCVTYEIYNGGVYNWNGGDYGCNTIRILSGGTMNFNVGGNPYLNETNITNDGVINFNSGGFYAAVNTVWGNLVNNTGGVINKNNDNDFNTYGENKFNFIQNGTLNINAGRLYINQLNFSNTGQLSIANNAELVCSGNPATLSGTLNVVEKVNPSNGSNVIISGAFSGNFSTVNLPIGYSITVNPSDIILNYNDDMDGDGVKNKDDCAPNDATKWRNGTFYKDADADTYTIGNAVTLCYGANTPTGYSATQKGTDCDDTDATKWRNGTFYKDADADTYTIGSAVTLCYGATTPTGYSATQKETDCDDTDATKWRNGTFYKDADADTYTTGSAVTICYGATTPVGYAITQKGTDCDDNDATKWRTGTFYKDTDGDTYTTGGAVAICYGSTTPSGYEASQKGTDCNDNNASVHPGATEICGNGIDEDCDGKDGVCAPIDTDGDGVPDNTDCAPNDKTKWQSAMLYIDADNDGYDNGQTAICFGETLPTGYKVTTLGKDCNDGNASIHPGAPEICGNGIDEDCDGNDGVCAPTDSDGDGVPDNTDCAPNDKTKWQSAMLYIDADNDGYDNGQTDICFGETLPTGYKATTLGKDCNDGNASIHPGATEICGNGIDEDCDGKDGVCVPVNVYYSKPSGDLNNVLSWGINPDGSGANPTDFGTGKTFNLANRAGNYTMTGNWTVAGTLVNPSGSQLKINGYTLSLTTLTGTGTLTGSATSSLILAGSSGGNFGNINFTSGGGMLKAFTLNRSGAGASATIGTALSVYDVLTVTSGALNTGGKLTLKSNDDGTARVAPVMDTISGNVTVERYIPARRAWRLINAPVGGNQTINQAWQEGATTASVPADPSPGYGTHITGGTLTNGFDQGPQSGASLKRFNAAGALQNVSGTYTSPVANKPYMLFVRGDRSVVMRDNNVPANNTTLRANGPLLTGNQTIPVAASGFTAVANPFASPINFGSITRTNVTNSFYVWDPKMGGTNGVGAYVNISYNGTGYDITPASVSPESQYIQSGQSFIVQSTGMAGSLVIKESDKSATPAQNVFRKSASDGGEGLVFAPARNAMGLRVNLQPADGLNSDVLDEVFASYGSDFSDDIDHMDARKAENMLENLAIIRNGQSLMVERRKPIQDADTLRLHLSNTSASTYRFEFSPIALTHIESVTLVDNYLKTNTAIGLTGTSQVYFQIGSDSRSSAPDRFSVILTNRKGWVPGRTVKEGIRVYPNPVTANGDISLQFDEIKAGLYRIELVNAAGQKVYSREMHLQNGSYHRQLNIGQNLPSGVYQLRITGKNSRKVLKLIRR